MECDFARRMNIMMKECRYVGGNAVFGFLTWLGQGVERTVGYTCKSFSFLEISGLAGV